jgi:spermidine synthase
MTNHLPAHLFAVLMLGVVSQVGQVLLVRELLMVFHGNELSIGIILSAWLAWVGAGSRLGALLVERVGRPLILLTLSAGAILLVLPLTIVLARSLRGFFDLLPGAHLSLWEMTISSFLLMAPVCLMLGAQFVLLSRVWRTRENSTDTTGAGKTYIGEAAGNVLGGLLFTFVLVHLFNSFQTSVILSALMLAAVVLIIGVQRGGWMTPGKAILFSTLALGSMVFALSLLERLDDLTHRTQWQSFSRQHELVSTHRSKHGDIAVLRREGQYSFFQSGHLIFSTAGPDTAAPGLEEQEAHIFAHFSMVQHRNPERILLIGGGLRGILGEIAKHPVQRIDYVELDQTLTMAALPFVSLETKEGWNDPRVRLFHTDARLFVKGSRDEYDMIIVDVPDPTTAVLNRFYTVEFFREARRTLHPEGVLVVGATSTPDLRGRALANRNAALYHTLSDVFSTVLPVGERFMFFFAADVPDQSSLDVPTLQQRYRERRIEAAGFSELHFPMLIQEQQTRRVNWVVRNHGRSPEAHLTGPVAVPLFPGTLEDQILSEPLLPPVESRHFINSDFKPIGYYYTLMHWDELTRGREGETLKRLLHITPWWFAPLVLFPVLAVLALRLPWPGPARQSATSFAVLFTVFTTGLSTMTMQVALLFSFQSIYGFIYETIGLIVALFMFGLAAGALLAHWRIADKSNLLTLALIQLAMALLAFLMALAIPKSAAISSPAAVLAFFSIMTFTAGLINGIDFPVAAACSMARTGSAEQSAGKVYGIELIGACFGAALASVLVAPVLGITMCFYLAAAVNGTAFVVLLLSRSSSCPRVENPVSG